MENEKMGKMGAKTPQGIEPREKTLRATRENTSSRERKKMQKKMQKSTLSYFLLKNNCYLYKRYKRDFRVKIGNMLNNNKKA